MNFEKIMIYGKMISSMDFYRMIFHTCFNETREKSEKRPLCVTAISALIALLYYSYVIHF